MPSSNRLIVIGASAGGVSALRQLAADLPASLAAPVLMVLHVGAHESRLPDLVGGDCALPVAHARDGEALTPGTIRVAPPDHHLMVRDGHLALTRSPKENFARPAIDPLFRSAALAADRGVIGVILTGMLDDGTAGMQAIKAAGGVAIVQDPADALEPSMPGSVLRHVDVDHCVGLSEIAPLLARLVSEPLANRTTAMKDSQQRARHEQALSLGTGNYLEHLRAIGEPSPFTCPECHGGLWQVKDTLPRRYRCHTGHAFTTRTLDLAIERDADAALWNALRALHEHGTVLDQRAAQSRNDQLIEEAERLERAARRVARQSKVLRSLLERSSGSPP
jgi:two-component system, chemotaxis family, protein-glutamate methylesterase/glutaminase